MWYKILLSFSCSFVFNLPRIFAESNEKVVHYTAETFQTEVPKNNHFVMFYAPWCFFCKKLDPTWRQLADILQKQSENDIVIAKVDCTVEKTLCSEHDVTGYPTLKFFKSPSTEGMKFKGTRDLPSFVSFLNEQLGKPPGKEIKVDVPPVTTNNLIELTESTFDDYTQKGNFFIKFYAPWCGHCQSLAPTWEDLAQSLDDNEEVAIAKVDCTVHRTVCNNLEIKGYPTLLWLQDGKVIEKYQGRRTESELKAYVNKMLEKKEIKPEEETVESSAEMMVLNYDNFQKGISSGISFVKFFAPWCGHCKRLAPIWNELNKKVVGISNVRLVKVDCTLGNNKELCNEQEVEGFPTLYLYKNGEKISEYNGSRNVDDMYEFLSKHFAHDEL